MYIKSIRFTVVFSILFPIITGSGYSQIEDILKKIPDIGDVFKPAVSTSIKDALPSSYWLNELDKHMQPQTDAAFSTNLAPGYYKFNCNTFCLHAGTYEPTEGAGYLVAPIKGSKANLIKNILSRYYDHQEIDQKDVQRLIWGIEAGMKFSSYPPDFQLRIQQLLTPDEIALMEVDVKETAIDLLPAEVKDLFNLYGNIRDKLSNANATYQEVEQLAVKTGIAPIGKGSKKVENGQWSSVGNGVYMRCFPHSYDNSDVEIYIPEDVNIETDISGRISSLDNGSDKLVLNYESSSPYFKSAVIHNDLTNEESTFDNNVSNYAAIEKEADSYINLVKKSFGKKITNRIKVQSLKKLKSLKITELFLVSDNIAHNLALNALNSFTGKLESGNIKGGGSSSGAGLNDFFGLIFAPGNPFAQRLGNGGPKGKKPTDCQPEVTINKPDQSYLPEPLTNFTVSVDVSNLNDCTIEGVRFSLFGVSKETGRCLNDKDPGWYDTRLDFYFDPLLNTKFGISGDSMEAEVFSPVSTTVTVSCNDYGAFGKLKAEVRIKGNWILAKVNNSNKMYVDLPYDDNNNHIADQWEINRNILGKKSNADDDPQPQDQKNDGDGMTVYEEYRGFYLSETAGGPVDHMRMNPKEKEIFVIDDDKLLSKKAWETATGIAVYFLTENEVYGKLAGADVDYGYRWVDFCQGYAPGKKYAINIIKVDGIVDPYNQCKDPDVCFAYALVGVPPIPKNCEKLVVMRDRVARSIKKARDGVDKELKNYPNKALIQYEGFWIIRSDAEDFVNYLNNQSNFELFVDYQMVLTMIHEMGHACGTQHHGGGVKGQEGTGAEWCPMRYISIEDQIKWISILPTFSSKDDFNSWYYCTPPDADNCWGQLNVDDKQ